MTLIASTLNHKMPFLMSDLLWSSLEYSNKPVRFPTNTFDLTPYLPNDLEEKSVRLGQKMYFLKDKTCIVFVGLSDEIKIFLTVIKHIFQNHDKILVKDIDEFLKKYKLEKNFNESAFFITHIENLQDGSIDVFQFYCPNEMNIVDHKKFNIRKGCWNVMDDPIYEKVTACGYGTKGYLNIIKQPVKFYSRFEDGDFMKAIQANTVLISKLLTMERVSLYTIKENWGGGFETAYFNGTKFEKLDKIAYIINHSQFDMYGDIGLPIPILIMYYKYENDILYILALEVHKYSISEAELNTIFTSYDGEYSTTLFEVEGIDVENINDYELPSDFSFTANKIAMGYSLVTKDNNIFNSAFFNFGPEVQITFQQTKSVEVIIDRKINEDIRSKAKQVFPNL